MNLDKPQYIAELKAAANMNLLDWYSALPNTYRRSVGKLTVEVSLNPRTGNWDWKLLHERSGQLSSGSSEHKDLSQQEAIKYAQHWVKNYMVGVLA